MKQFLNIHTIQWDKVIEAQNQLNNIEKFEYDVLGNLIKEDRAGGRITTYEYDNVGNLTKSTNALGNSKTYTYNKDNNITSAIDELGNKNSYTYDIKGQVIETINSKNAKRVYTYDANGNVTSITNELGNMKKYNYDLLDRLTEVEDERTVKTSYKYDSVGNMVEQTNANGAVTQYNYDLLSRLKQSIDANGNITTYNYDKESNLTEVIKADGNTINYDYDKINELVSKESEQDEDINAMYGYDKTGKLIKMEDCLGTTSYEYDDAGRISKVTMQDGKQLEYKYDDLSRLNEIVYPDGKSVKYIYDVLDNLQTVVDRDGDTTAYEYDAKNRVTKTIRPNGSYTVISYNELDTVNKLENFVGEQTISTFEYQYNDKGQIVKETASNQNVTSVKDFAYDERGELLLYKEDIGGKITITTYAYDNAGNRISKELKVNEQTVTTEYTYNSLNQLLKESTDGKDITYTYDSNGNLIKKADGNTTLTYNYTVEDRLQAVKDGDNILMASIYDGNGDRVFSVSPKNYKVKSNNGNHYGQENGNNGNNGNNDNDGGINNNGNGNNNGNNGNHYGNNKNKENVFEEIPQGEKYTANVIDYNHNGKISVGEMKRANKNKQAETEEIIFIPLGITHQNRNKYELIQYINDVTTENTQVLMEYGKKAKDTMAYNYGNERLSYEDAKNKNGADTYNYDGRGSVSNILDNNGTSMVEYSCDAFGETTISGKEAKKTENRYQFNGENTDNVTGLQYLRARYYDSTTGRFISADTYAGDISDPLTTNKYLYTNNDPVNYIDPTGHFLGKLFNTIGSYVEAGWKSAGDIGNGIWQAIKDPNHDIGKAINDTKANIQNNFREAQNKVENYGKPTNVVGNINVGGNSTSKNKVTNVKTKQGPPIPSGVKTNSSYVRPTYGAAVNSKVEQSRQIENQIRLLRQQGTAEANMMADYLQANMKKLCESGLGKIEISNVEMGKKWYEKLGEGVKNTVYSVGATTSGFINSVVNNVAGTDLSNLYLFEGYEKAYYGGAIGGDIVSGIIGLAETIVGPIMAGMGIVTTGGGIFVSSTGVGIVPGMAVSGVGVAITTVGVAATGQGVGIIGNSGNSLSDHIQNIKDSGTSNNNSPKEFHNSIKDSSNYPEGFTERQNGTTKKNVKNKELLDKLRKTESGEWKKVYKDGYDANGNEISIHYFQSKSGKVFDVKVKNKWSN